MIPGSPEAVAKGCICRGDTFDGRRVRSWQCPVHGCTCRVDWRSGQRVLNPDCNISHGSPTPPEPKA